MEKKLKKHFEKASRGELIQLDSLKIKTGDKVYAFIGRTRVPVTVNIVRKCELQPEIRIAMYRIARESLNNIAKHAKATQVKVLLDCKPERVVLTIQDKGRGFNSANTTCYNDNSI